MPVRLVFDKEGRVMGTDTLDIGKGELVMGSYLCAVRTGPFSKEITEEEFNTLCERLLKNRDKA